MRKITKIEINVEGLNESYRSKFKEEMIFTKIEDAIEALQKYKDEMQEE